MMCIDFNCTPNDLLDYIPSKGQNLAEDHALKGLSKSNAIAEVNKMLYELPVEKIERLYSILKGQKNEVE